MVDSIRYNGCEDNMDIQVLDCPLFHTTTFVTTQQLSSTIDHDDFGGRFTSTMDMLETDDMEMTTDSPDSIEIDEAFSLRNHIILLHTIAVCFISTVLLI